MNRDKLITEIEQRIIELQNENYGDTHINVLMDALSQLVLAEYYESEEYQDVIRE